MLTSLEVTPTGQLIQEGEWLTLDEVAEKAAEDARLKEELEQERQELEEQLINPDDSGSGDEPEEGSDEGASDEDDPDEEGEE